MTTPFHFDSYQLVEISYKPGIQKKSGTTEPEPAEKSGDKKKKQYSINIRSSISICSKKKNKYQFALQIDVSESIEAKIVLNGYFTGSNFYPNRDIERKELTPIGMALLLPIARSILAGVSAQDGSKPYLLPTLNLSELLCKSDLR
jgi:preprotein translocase subunit SecB